jgi:hypothetical protein
MEDYLYWIICFFFFFSFTYFEEKKGMGVHNVKTSIILFFPYSLGFVS